MARVWRAQDATVRLSVVTCPTVVAARVYAWGYLHLLDRAPLKIKRHGDRVLVLSPTLDDGQPTVDGEVLESGRTLVLSSVELVDTSDLDGTDVLDAVTGQQAALLSSPPDRAGPPDPHSPPGTLDSFLTLAMFGLLLRPHAILNKVWRGRYSRRQGDPRWVDITSLARRVRWTHRARTAAGALTVVMVSGAALALRVQVLSVGIAVALAIVAWAPLPARWMPATARATAATRGASRAAASPDARYRALTGVATALLGAGLIILLARSLLSSAGFNDAPMLRGGWFDPAYLDTTSGNSRLYAVVLWLAPIGRAASAGPWAATLCIVAAVVIRRLAARTAHSAPATAAEQASGGSLRLPVRALWPREDVRLAARLVGVPLIDRVAWPRRRPFRPVAARWLGRLGPFAPFERPTDPAAAVVALVGESEHLARVDQLAPQLAVAAASAPLCVILPPLPERVLTPRWRLFLTAAAGQPRLAGLLHFEQREEGEVQVIYSGTLVAVQATDGSWRVWGARRRTEWTYAVALSLATDFIIADRTHNRSVIANLAVAQAPTVAAGPAGVNGATATAPAPAERQTRHSPAAQSAVEVTATATAAAWNHGVPRATEMTSSVTDVFGDLASRIHGRPVNTRDVLLALPAVDHLARWQRLWTHTADPDYLAGLHVADGDPAAAAPYAGTSLTGTCVRALRLASLLAAHYDLGPVPPAVLALAVVVDPDGAAARALAATGLSEREVVDLVRDTVLGIDLDNLDDRLPELARAAGIGLRHTP
ncbi:hypothetical protein I6A60_26705 [Frankia sp. AgB1.9]|uniref:hypothetical protein n=1 Tax=unclassified Frankia TaxID=2632575 RepID=UPI001933B819|nr:MULTISPECIES: hypothetical protein [unclassified Frankia]MBL7488600.1 hypothetical protein [Frankia sp. AgW1.1]MBL7551422.1 hypothetical protein [Frankia sp. AgB1.9]MBL7622675.1 hypothetical protein [Frankia sp. AgB1.8]